MKKRVITATIFGLVFFPAIYFGGIYFLICAIFLVGFGTYELMNMFYKKDETLKYMRFILPIFSVILFGLIYLSNVYSNYNIHLNANEYNEYHLMLVDLSSIGDRSSIINMYTIIAYVFFVIIIFIVNLFKKNSTSHFATSSILSLTYGGLLFSLALSLEYMRPIIIDGETMLWGGQLFAYYYVTVVFTDMFAFFTGRTFGKHKLIESVSPNKTIEGAIGGLLIGSVFGTLAAYLFGVMPISSNMNAGTKICVVALTFLITVILSFLVQIGDLVASKLKRSYDIKDYSNIFPGHGGVIDRFDSTIIGGALLSLFLVLIRLVLL